VNTLHTGADDDDDDDDSSSNMEGCKILSEILHES
jgi:hypothetical protein